MLDYNDLNQVLSLLSTFKKVLPTCLDTTINQVKLEERINAALDNISVEMINLEKQKEAKKQKLFQEAKSMIDYLKHTFPGLFSSPPRPLAIGIDHQLYEIINSISFVYPARLNKRVLDEALKHWCNTTAYLQEVANHPLRYDFGGNPIEYVTDEQRNEAKARLGYRKRRKELKALQQAA